MQARHSDFVTSFTQSGQKRRCSDCRHKLIQAEELFHVVQDTHFGVSASRDIVSLDQPVRMKIGM
jgi:hypothetical protein